MTPQERRRCEGTIASVSAFARTCEDEHKTDAAARAWAIVERSRAKLAADDGGQTP